MNPCVDDRRLAAIFEVLSGRLSEMKPLAEERSWEIEGNAASERGEDSSESPDLVDSSLDEEEALEEKPSEKQKARRKYRPALKRGREFDGHTNDADSKELDISDSDEDLEGCPPVEGSLEMGVPILMSQPRAEISRASMRHP